MRWIAEKIAFANTMRSHITQLILTALNRPIESISPIGGGSIAVSHRVTMEDGAQYFVKVSPQHTDMFLKEANGLQELNNAHVFRLPEVIAVSNTILILEFLPAATPEHRTQFFEQFGKQFAELHRTAGTQFGFYENNYIGSTPQLNVPQKKSWKEFFFVHRLEFQFRLAEQNGYAHQDIAVLFHRLEKSFDRMIPDDGEPPALLHGDLWNGNFLCTTNDIPVLIDPAVYYGHREADVAMTRLFGGFNEAFYRSYNESYPLNDEWERRMDLYALYHLFNHLNLFGEGYSSQVYESLKKLLK